MPWAMYGGMLGATVMRSLSVMCDPVYIGSLRASFAKQSPREGDCFGPHDGPRNDCADENWNTDDADTADYADKFRILSASSASSA